MGADRDARSRATVKALAMISGSPACRPQATFAEVTIESIASSSPQR